MTGVHDERISIEEEARTKSYLDANPSERKIMREDYRVSVLGELAAAQAAFEAEHPAINQGLKTD